MRGSTHRICKVAEGKSSRGELEGEVFAFFFLTLTAATTEPTATLLLQPLPSLPCFDAAAACLSLFARADFSLAMASETLALSGCCCDGTSSLTIGTPGAGGGEASLLRAGTNWSRLKFPAEEMLSCCCGGGSSSGGGSEEEGGLLPATTTTGALPRVCSWLSLGMCRGDRDKPKRASELDSASKRERERDKAGGIRLPLFD